MINVVEIFYFISSYIRILKIIEKTIQKIFFHKLFADFIMY